MASRLMFVSDTKFKQQLVGVRAGRLEKSTLDNLAVLKASAARAVKAFDPVNRLLDICISTDSVDRMDDTIALDGWDLRAYHDNPVVLFGHDQWNPPVAKSIKLWKQPGAPGELWARAQFIERDIYPFAFMMFQLYAGGYMRAASVGFRPTEYEMSDDRKGGIEFTAQELLEWSCVPVPANAEALAQARSAGVELAPMKAWAEHWLDTAARHDDGDTRERATVERLRAASDSAGRSLIGVIGDLRFTPTERASTMPPTVKLHASTNADFPFACAHGHGHQTANEARDCTIVKIEPAKATVPSVPKDMPGDEAAELVKYQAMRAQLVAHQGQLAAALEQVDALISAETENPTETPEAEAAEENVEAARLSVILGYCAQMHGAVAGLESLVMTCLGDDASADTEIGGGRGGRAATDTARKAGARHSADDVALGKAAAGHLEDAHGKLIDLGFGQKPAEGGDAGKAAKAGARHSAADLAVGKAAMTSLRAAHGKLVELAFADALPDPGDGDENPDDQEDADEAVDDKGGAGATTTAGFAALADDADFDMFDDTPAEEDAFDQFLGMSQEELRGAMRDAVKDAFDVARGRIVD